MGPQNADHAHCVVHFAKITAWSIDGRNGYVCNAEAGMSCAYYEICFELVPVAGCMNFVENFATNSSKSRLTVVHRPARHNSRCGCGKEVRHSSASGHLLTGEVSCADCNVTRFKSRKN